MRRFLKHIMAIGLAFMFLVSFTGVRLFMHHCLSCETTEVSVLGISLRDASKMHREHAESCHLPMAGTESDKGGNCCDAADNEEAPVCGDCCESEFQYLKNDTRVPHERAEIRVVPVEFELAFASFLFVITGDNIPGVDNSYQVPDRAPPKLTGRDFVIYSNQLKVS